MARKWFARTTTSPPAIRTSPTSVKPDVRRDPARLTFPLYIEVDAIFNLACPASPIHYQRDPVLPQDDPRQRQPDLSKAKALLNWEPKVALADGLKETIAYFRRSLELS